MCCGYKYFPTGASGISGFQQCFLTAKSSTNPDIYSQDYRKQNLFLTQTIVPDCIDDNSIGDRDGDTCEGYYDFDNGMRRFGDMRCYIPKQIIFKEFDDIKDKD